MRILLTLVVTAISLGACGSETTNKTTAGFGESCTTNADCSSDYCLEFNSGPSICSIPCDSLSEGDACGNSGACVVEGTDKKFCLPKCSSLADCEAVNASFTSCEVHDSGLESICLASDKTTAGFGESCTTNADCSSDYCLEFNSGTSVCSVLCNSLSEGDACGDNGACVVEGADKKFCLPKCSSLADCQAVNTSFTSCEVHDSSSESICLP